MRKFVFIKEHYPADPEKKNPPIPYGAIAEEYEKDKFRISVDVGVPLPDGCEDISAEVIIRWFHSNILDQLPITPAEQTDRKKTFHEPSRGEDEEFIRLEHHKWYFIGEYDPRHRFAALVYYIEGAPVLYGWGHDGKWTENYNSYTGMWKGGIRRANSENVFIAFENTAKGKGYEKGDKVESLMRSADHAEILEGELSYFYQVEEEGAWHFRDTLTMGETVIYTQGQWAEIKIKGGEKSEEEKEEDARKDLLTTNAALTILNGLAAGMTPDHISQAEEKDMEMIWEIARKFVDAKPK